MNLNKIFYMLKNVGLILLAIIIAILQAILYLLAIIVPIYLIVFILDKFNLETIIETIAILFLIIGSIACLYTLAKENYQKLKKRFFNDTEK